MTTGINPYTARWFPPSKEWTGHDRHCAAVTFVAIAKMYGAVEMRHYERVAVGARQYLVGEDGKLGVFATQPLNQNGRRGSSIGGKFKDLRPEFWQVLRGLSIHLEPWAPTTTGYKPFLETWDAEGVYEQTICPWADHLVTQHTVSEAEIEQAITDLAPAMRLLNMDRLAMFNTMLRVRGDES